MFTPGNELKWDATERTRGIKDYTNAETIVQFGLANNMRIRGHNLVWHQQLPGWVWGLSSQELQSAMQSRIRLVIWEKYKTSMNYKYITANY